MVSIARPIASGSFSTGAARYDDHHEESGEQAAKIWVRFAPGDSVGEVHFAQLDTGATWSILSLDLAEALSLLDRQGEEVPMRTARAGTITGRLERTTLLILADAGRGQSLSLEATVFVSRDWHHPTFLGYSGPRLGPGRVPQVAVALPLGSGLGHVAALASDRIGVGPDAVVGAGTEHAQGRAEPFERIVRHDVSVPPSFRWRRRGNAGRRRWPRWRR